MEPHLTSIRRSAAGMWGFARGSARGGPLPRPGPQQPGTIANEVDQEALLLAQAGGAQSLAGRLDQVGRRRGIREAAEGALHGAFH